MKSYLLIHSIACLVPALLVVYLYHFVVRGTAGLGLLYLTSIGVFFLCILTGILGTRYSGSIWIPAAINCAVVVVAMGLTEPRGVAVLVPAVFFVTFVCSLFTWFILYGSSGILLQRASTLLFVLILLAGTYAFFAFINGPVHRGDRSFFFHTGETPTPCEKVTITTEQYEEYLRYAGTAEERIGREVPDIYSATILVDEAGNPYSGTLFLYSPKLKINPLPRKKEALLYYLDGYLWGWSWAETHLPTEFTGNALLHLPGMPASHPFLIDKNYAERAREILSAAGAYCLLPDHRLIAWGEDGKIYQGEVGYHHNGLLRYVRWDVMDLEAGFDWIYFESRYFDELGYSDDRSAWNADDFIPTDVVPEVVRAGAADDPEKIRFMEQAFLRPERVWLPGSSYAWNPQESLGVNLCGLHGFTGKEHSIEGLFADPRDRSVHEMEATDRERVLRMLDCCRIETRLDTRKRGTWYSDATAYFILREKGTGKKLSLGYKDGRFIMENNFYSFVFPEEVRDEWIEAVHGWLDQYPGDTL